jgi:hypothetical protein
MAGRHLIDSVDRAGLSVVRMLPTTLKEFLVMFSLVIYSYSILLLGSDLWGRLSGDHLAICQFVGELCLLLPISQLVGLYRDYQPVSLDQSSLSSYREWLGQ